MTISLGIQIDLRVLYTAYLSLLKEIGQVLHSVRSNDADVLETAIEFALESPFILPFLGQSFRFLFGVFDDGYRLDTFFSSDRLVWLELWLDSLGRFLCSGLGFCCFTSKFFPYLDRVLMSEHVRMVVYRRFRAVSSAIGRFGEHVLDLTECYDSIVHILRY